MIMAINNEKLINRNQYVSTQFSEKRQFSNCYARAEAHLYASFIHYCLQIVQYHIKP